MLYLRVAFASAETGGVEAFVSDGVWGSRIFALLYWSDSGEAMQAIALSCLYTGQTHMRESTR